MQLMIVNFKWAIIDLQGRAIQHFITKLFCALLAYLEDLILVK